MKNRIKTLLAVLLLANATGCNVTSGSRIVVGSRRQPIAPESVKIYVRPPTEFEEIAIVSASSKNAFASDQSLTDSALFQMKKDAAKLGANGILLGGVGSQQIGSVGSTFGSATAYSTGSATAYRYGNAAIFAKVTNGMAIYVTRE